MIASQLQNQNSDDAWLEADTWGSWWLAHKLIGQAVKAGEPVPEFMLSKNTARQPAPESRLCANHKCRAPLVLHENERARNFKNRKCCSRCCSASIGARAKNATPRPQRERATDNPRSCANPKCRAPIIQRKNERPRDFGRRACCSRSCADIVGAVAKSKDTSSCIQLCRICADPIPAKALKRGRSTCGAYACFVAASTHKPFAGGGWPKRDGQEPRGFEQHNLRLAPQPSGSRIDRAPPDRTFGGVGSSWMA
jgi:hypothetical protein